MITFPKNQKKWAGLFIYCKKCRSEISNLCNLEKENKKPVSLCKDKDKHIFKAIVHIPNTRNSRKTMNLKAKNYNDAVKEAIDFQAQVKSNTHLERKPVLQKEVHTTKRPLLLIQGLAKYLAWLSGEGVPEHQRRNRGEEHLKDLQSQFTRLIEALKHSNFNVENLYVEDVSDELVGKIYQFLLVHKKYSNRTYNKHISNYNAFYRWYKREYNISATNPFELVQKKKLNYKPKSISQELFNKIIKSITPENGKVIVKNKSINYYRTWLKNAVLLGLFTGGRREEVVRMKFSDVIENEDGVLCLKIPDYKINRIQQRIREEEKKYKYIPVTNELHKLLVDMNYDEYKNTNRFLLAHEDSLDRNAMQDQMSRSFTHFAKLVAPSEEISFKNLRKTFITKLQIYSGGRAKEITGHSGNDIIEKHYIDHELVAFSVKNFEIFPEKEQVSEKENDLGKIREKIQKGKGISK